MCCLFCVSQRGFEPIIEMPKEPGVQRTLFAGQLESRNRQAQARAIASIQEMLAAQEAEVARNAAMRATKTPIAFFAAEVVAVEETFRTTSKNGKQKVQKITFKNAAIVVTGKTTPEPDDSALLASCNVLWWWCTFLEDLPMTSVRPGAMIRATNLMHLYCAESRKGNSWSGAKEHTFRFASHGSNSTLQVQAPGETEFVTCGLKRSTTTGD
jgi:hypothetical protein